MPFALTQKVLYLKAQNRNMSTQILLIIAIATIINLFVLYLIIQSATRSKRIAEAQEHQLKVLIEIALASGVNKDAIEVPLNYYGYAMVRKAEKEYTAGKITHDALRQIKQQYGY